MTDADLNREEDTTAPDVTSEPVPHPPPPSVEESESPVEHVVEAAAESAPEPVAEVQAEAEPEPVVEPEAPVETVVEAPSELSESAGSLDTPAGVTELPAGEAAIQPERQVAHETVVEPEPVVETEAAPEPVESAPEVSHEPAPESAPEPVESAPEVSHEPAPESAPEPATEPKAGAPSELSEVAGSLVTPQGVTELPAGEAATEPEREVAAETVVEPDSEPVVETEAAPEAVVEIEAPVDPEPAQTPEDVPTPAVMPAHPAASVPAPSPAMFARSHGAPDRSAFGRVADDGVVFVKTADGEREVGSYPGATSSEALAYFARKYDEILAAADLLHQRVTQTDITAKDAEESFAKLKEQVQEPNAVGDLPALEARVAEIGAAVESRKSQETEQRAAAREEGRAHREALVVEAEKIAGQPEEKIQWKNSGARMRELLDEWKAHQRSGPRLDRASESSLWQRFSAARNSFDRARRVHFAQLDGQQSEAKVAKERLVAEAERLSTSKDWAPTAGAFKKLMDEWRRAGRAGRADDDALWERFRTAQDTFFNAKDEVVAKEEESFRGNLEVKLTLLKEAEAILPVTDLEQAKTALRGVQDRWDKAGKVPRADIDRTEKAIRRIEQTVRDAEEKRWSSSNPEAAARAQSLVDQLETAVAGLRDDLAKAEASGNQKKIDQARSALEAREQWLAQARAGVEEFG